MCQGFVHSNSGLIACRVVLGAAEAGWVPGAAYLLSMYYKRHESQKRFTLFWTAGILAGAFGGLLAYALVHMHGIGGCAGWRWVLIIEGLMSIVVSVPAKFILMDWPEQTRVLTPEEKLFLHAKLAGDLEGAKMDRLDKTAWQRILLDWKVIVMSLSYLGVTTSGYATALFIPTIIKSLGYTGISSQVHSIPIWIVAAVVALATAVVTDHVKHRYAFIMFGVSFASIGYILLLCGPTLSMRVRYMAVFFVTTGCYIAQPLTLVWLTINLGGHYKRAISLALQVGVGNIGGIIASNVFVQSDAPRFHRGYRVSLAMLLFCGFTSTIFALGLVWENRKRDRGERDHRLRLPERELSNLGDDDPRFRFVL